MTLISVLLVAHARAGIACVIHDGFGTVTSVDLSTGFATITTVPESTNASLLTLQSFRSLIVGLTVRSMTVHAVPPTATSSAACVVSRKYNHGAWTTETFGQRFGGDATEWSFRAGSTSPRRQHVEIATSLAVKYWDERKMKWWMATTAPSDGGQSPGLSTAPFDPRTDVTNGTSGEPLLFTYGGTKFGIASSSGLPSLAGSDDGYVLPVLTVLAGTGAKSAISFVESPGSSTTYADIAISRGGGGDDDDEGDAHFVWTKRLLGIGGQAQTIQLTGLLSTHAGCWRPGLGSFWREWGDYATPHRNVNLSRTEGAATYAYFFDQFNETESAAAAHNAAAMDLRMNWDASFPWLYHGPWIPFKNNREYFPVHMVSKNNSEFTWRNCDPAGHGGHAIRKEKPDWPVCMDQNVTLLNGWYKALLHKFQVETLIYGTLEEYGIGINVSSRSFSIGNALHAGPAGCSSTSQNYTQQLVCGANRLFRDRFPEAFMIDPATNRSVSAAWDSIIVDFADPQYTEFLLNNTRDVVDSFQHSVAGVCLDRGDYIGLLNAKAGVDDGVTTTPDSRPGRALVNSWKVTTSSIANILHQHSMALFANPDMGHRVDMYKDVDGFYSELGDRKPGKWRTGTALLSSGGKSAAIWCHAKGDIETKCAEMMTNGTDTERNQFLQSHLLLGVFPTVTFPDNDHAILPHPRADQIYTDYGHLFAATHGKRWSTSPHAVRITSAPTTAAANIFEMKPFGSGCYTIAVAWSNTTSIDLVLGSGLGGGQPSSLAPLPSCSVLHPGGAENSPLQCQITAQRAINNVPLRRGCAVIQLCLFMEEVPNRRSDVYLKRVL